MNLCVDKSSPTSSILLEVTSQSHFPEVAVELFVAISALYTETEQSLVSGRSRQIMSTTDLVFVTTTGRLGLSRTNTKLMRGHVTRSNFAKRRRRKAELQRAEHELWHIDDRHETPVLKTQEYSIGREKFSKDSPSPKSRINTDTVPVSVRLLVTLLSSRRDLSRYPPRGIVAATTRLRGGTRPNFPVHRSPDLVA